MLPFQESFDPHLYALLRRIYKTSAGVNYYFTRHSSCSGPFVRCDPCRRGWVSWRDLVSCGSLNDVFILCLSRGLFTNSLEGIDKSRGECDLGLGRYFVASWGNVVIVGLLWFEVMASEFSLVWFCIMILSTLVILSVIRYRERSFVCEFRRLRCAHSHDSNCKLQRNCTLKDAAKFHSRLPHFELPRREFPRCPTSWQWRPDFGLSLHFQRLVNQSDVTVATVM